MQPRAKAPISVRQLHTAVWDYVRLSAGTILALHDVTEDIREGSISPNMGVKAGKLDRLLTHATKRRVKFISMDELTDALEHGTSLANTMVITFDDGYLGALTRGVDICASHGVPSCHYLPTAFMDRRGLAWWLALNDAVQQFGLNDASEDVARVRSELVGARMADWPVILETAFPGFNPDWAGYGMLFAGWDLVLQHRASSLVTIGSHTRYHQQLRTLPDDEAWREIGDSRTELHERLGKEVKHFAYPFGGPADFGAREVEMIQRSGYASATTTNFAWLWAHTGASTFALPRLFFTDRTDHSRHQSRQLRLRSVANEVRLAINRQHAQSAHRDTPR